VYAGLARRGGDTKRIRSGEDGDGSDGEVTWVLDTSFNEESSRA
jgi:hypothetical protein